MEEHLERSARFWEQNGERKLEYWEARKRDIKTYVASRLRGTTALRRLLEKLGPPTTIYKDTQAAAGGYYSLHRKLEDALRVQHDIDDTIEITKTESPALVDAREHVTDALRKGLPVWLKWYLSDCCSDARTQKLNAQRWTPARAAITTAIDDAVEANQEARATWEEGAAGRIGERKRRDKEREQLKPYDIGNLFALWRDQYVGTQSKMIPVLHQA